jgi:hypothetical protein
MAQRKQAQDCRTEQPVEHEAHQSRRMVLDNKKGLLKADKEKGQYVDTEKRKSKEK